MSHAKNIKTGIGNMLRLGLYIACFVFALAVVRFYVDYDWCATILQLILGYILTSTLYAFVTSYLPLSLLPDLKSKAIIVTGCDSGFGNELAQRLDSLGVTVYAGCLFADGSLAKELKQKTSERLHIVQLDVTKQNEVDDAVKYVKDTLKDKVLWSVINNAGIATFGEFEWHTIDEVKKEMDVNFLGQVRMTNAFLPLLRDSKGRVVNVISVAGRFGVAMLGPYSCSKHASQAFTDTIRVELKKMSISVHSIEPAAVFRTPMADGLHFTRIWDSTPSDIKKAYGIDYGKGTESKAKFILNMFARPKSHMYLVVDCLVDASLGTHPKDRYIPGFIEDRLIPVIEILPNSVITFVSEIASQPFSLARIFRCSK